jgi:hypothetical protein
MDFLQKSWYKERGQVSYLVWKALGLMVLSEKVFVDIRRYCADAERRDEG